MELVEHVKEKIEDKAIFGAVTESFERKELVRVFAVKITFTDTSFKQAVLSGCYFRNCTFIRCDFTGASFKDCYLKGSSFDGCKFEYSTWEKTQLDEEFLTHCLPSQENLARDLVRSLRVNFGQIGNYTAVNRAAAIEVKLTGLHLFNASYSQQAYYRKKEKNTGLLRLKNMAMHFQWRVLEFLWGNGESTLRVAINGVLIIVFFAMLLTGTKYNYEFWDALWLAFLGFWGEAKILPETIKVALTVSRFVLVGLFMSILVKRLSRR